MSGDSFVANGSALPPAKSGTSRPSRAPALRTLPRRLVRFASPPRLPNNLPPHLRPSLHLPRSLETSKLSGFFKLRPLCFRRRPQEKSSFRDLGAKVFVIVSSKSETPAFQPARGVVQRKTQWALGRAPCQCWPRPRPEPAPSEKQCPDTAPPPAPFIPGASLLFLPTIPRSDAHKHGDQKHGRVHGPRRKNFAAG
jgi:hypothetical protein